MVSSKLPALGDADVGKILYLRSDLKENEPLLPPDLVDRLGRPALIVYANKTTQEAIILTLTSFGKRQLDEKFKESNTRARANFIPIAPTPPHPDNQRQLFTTSDNWPTPSYLKVSDPIKVPRRYLEQYRVAEKYRGARAGRPTRIELASYHNVIDFGNLTAPSGFHGIPKHTTSAIPSQTKQQGTPNRHSPSTGSSSKVSTATLYPHIARASSASSSISRLPPVKAPVKAPVRHSLPPSPPLSPSPPLPSPSSRKPSAQTPLPLWDGSYAYYSPPPPRVITDNQPDQKQVSSYASTTPIVSTDTPISSNRYTISLGREQQPVLPRYNNYSSHNTIDPHSRSGSGNPPPPVDSSVWLGLGILAVLAVVGVVVLASQISLKAKL